MRITTMATSAMNYFRSSASTEACPSPDLYFPFEFELTNTDTYEITTQQKQGNG